MHMLNKMAHFLIFFAVLITFSRISAKTHALLASLLMLVLLFYFWHPCCWGSPSPVDVFDVTIVSAAVADVLVMSSCCCCWCPCWMLLSSLLFLNFFLFASGGPAAVDIHDVLIVPAAAVISDVNSVPACCCRLHYFCKHLRFCWRPYCFGCPVVALIPVAWICADVGSQAIAVILAVACC